MRRGGLVGGLWALAALLAACPAADEGAGAEATPAASPAVALAQGGATVAARSASGPTPFDLPALASPALASPRLEGPPPAPPGPWPSPAAPLAARPWGPPEAVLGLDLKAGMPEAALRQQLEGMGYGVSTLRRGGQPAPPEGQAWAYAESGLAENRHVQSLWLRFSGPTHAPALAAIACNLSAAEREAALGGRVDAVGEAQRRAAWAWVGPSPTALRPEGQDLAAGPGLRLRCPREFGGDAEVEGRLQSAAESWALPMALPRWTEPGLVAEAFVSADRHRLVLFERLPFSGLRLPHHFQRAPGAKAFQRLAAPPA